VVERVPLVAQAGCFFFVVGEHSVMLGVVWVM
jgi:hypothetical protein